MKAIVDTHALIWALDQPARLGTKAKTFLQDPANDLLLSAATIWELAIKIGLKKLSLSLPYRQWMSQAMADLSLTVLPITVDYADVLVTLPLHHRDPFDRLLAAQATVDNLTLVSEDGVFDQYGVTRIWN